MQRNIDINSEEWCEIVFNGQNKAYGAFILRKLSNKRHLMALVIVSVFFMLALFLPALIRTVLPEKKERMVEVTSLSDLKVEQNKPREENIITAPPPPPLKSSIKFTPPVIKPDEEVAVQDEIKTQETLNEAKVAISVADIKGTYEVSGIDVAELNERKEITKEEPREEEVFYIVEQMPEFPGGENALRKFIADKLMYPVIAQENGIQGKVYVSFIVDKDGSIKNAIVVRSVDPSLDREALRVINSLPKWNPGKQRGRPVKVSFTVPIIFILQ
jgi:protein TonB